MQSAKNFYSAVSNTLVTLTLPYPLVTFRLKPFFSDISLWVKVRSRPCSGGNMKKTGLLVLLLAAVAGAQTVPSERVIQSGAVPDLSSIQAPQGTEPTSASFPLERIPTPTYADLYCAGFISRQSLPNANFIAGGLETPTTTKFERGDLVFLKGTGYAAGAEYEIVRALKDVNEYEMFPGQKKVLKQAGQPYEEVGRIKVIDTRSRTAVAEVEYTCDSIGPGDTAIPFVEKQTIPAHGPIRFDRFLPANRETSGRIVMAKDFDSQLGIGQKVYINVGSKEGVKIGDYFRAVRSYVADLNDPVDSLSFRAQLSEDTQMKQTTFDPGMFEKGNGPVIHVRDLPRRAVGELVIISVTDTTATGMIVFANEDVHTGDGVELDTLNN
jgi:hypothetical protein